MKRKGLTKRYLLTNDSGQRPSERSVHIMLRRTTAALAGSVTALALLATACGGGADQGASSTAAKKTGEVTFWSFVKGSDKVAEAFNRSHPDIKVTFETVPSGQEYYSKLTNAVKAGTAPDVAVVEFPHLPEFAAQGKVEDLTGLLGPVVRERFPTLRDSWSTSATGPGESRATRRP